MCWKFASVIATHDVSSSGSALPIKHNPYTNHSYWLLVYPEAASPNMNFWNKINKIELT
jgi:hypothetical protein